jgi:NAD-specific glutamate dehydrogenase
MGVANSRSLRYVRYVRMQHFVRQFSYVPFRRSLGDVRRGLMQRLFACLHGTLVSYLRDALQEGNVNIVVRLHVPRA